MYFISFLLGILIKLYDDIFDLHLVEKYNIKLVFIYIIKYLIIYLSILLGIYNYTNSIIMFLALLTSNYVKTFDNSFWLNYTITIGLFNILFSYNIINIFNFFYVKLFCIICIILLILFEEKTFIEEFSILKQKSRLLNIFINTILIIILDMFNIINKYDLSFIKPFLIFVNSYFMVSIIIQNIKL